MMYINIFFVLDQKKSCLLIKKNTIIYSFVIISRIWKFGHDERMMNGEWVW